MSNRRQVQTDQAPAPGGTYSQGVVAGGLLFTAGLGPQDPVSGQVVGADIGAQAEQVMTNLQGLLASEGLGFGDVVKATVHLQDVARDFKSFDEVYRRHVHEPYPVRTTVGSDLLGILVEIDVVAARP